MPRLLLSWHEYFENTIVRKKSEPEIGLVLRNPTLLITINN